jgi:hypothetical protein
MKWLIDGHNLIGQMPNLRLDDPDDEAKLVELLRGFQVRTGHQVTVVFDAGPSYHPTVTKKSGGVTVQFAPSGQTADQVIARRLRRVKNPQEVVVVSSDRTVQQAARQAQVRVLPTREFGQQLQPSSVEAVEDDRGSRVEVKLSADEVDEWLKFFKKQGKP